MHSILGIHCNQSLNVVICVDGESSLNTSRNDDDDAADDSQEDGRSGRRGGRTRRSGTR